MTSENLVLEQLKEHLNLIQMEISAIKADTTEIKHHLGGAEMAVATVRRPSCKNARSWDFIDSGARHAI